MCARILRVSQILFQGRDDGRRVLLGDECAIVRDVALTTRYSTAAVVLVAAYGTEN